MECVDMACVWAAFNMRYCVDGLGLGHTWDVRELGLICTGPQPYSQFLICLQDGKRMLGSLSPQMRNLFETGADLGLVEGEKLQWGEKSL